MSDLILAADLGGTNLRMAAVDSVGHPHNITKRPVPKGVSPAGLIDLVEEMSSLCCDGLHGEVRALGFTAPSPIQLDFDGVLTKLPNLGSVTGMNFKRDLEDLFKLPVFMENDATAAAIGENWIGASRDVQNSVCVTLGTGIGGGIIINGEPLRGPDGIGGEIGHITVEPNGRPCKCGSIGCIEEYASATAITRMAVEFGMNVANAGEVYEAWQTGDEKAESVFASMGRYLGITLAGLANALNPEMLVICGGVTAGWDAFSHHVTAEIEKRAYPAAAKRAVVARCGLGDNAGIIGAARSAFLRGSI
ncbi:MAG: ROK family protein [Acidobacteria bacterium]|nr:ROK family protein [Acidobacteriota bacterium]